MSKTFKLIFLSIVLIQSHLMIGQESNFIYGKLINTDDQTPIPFVHITIKNKAKGTISNMDGGFRIPLEYYTSGDTLVISSIGYSSKKIPLVDLDPKIRNVIMMFKSAEVLDEIALGNPNNATKNVEQNFDDATSLKKKRLKANDIVQLALDRIPKNYPFKPFSFIGYYRDYQLKEGDYFNLNEALLQVFDAGFGVHDYAGTQTRIYRYDKNHNFPIDTLAAEPYEYAKRNKIVFHVGFGNPKLMRNEFTLLRTHDAIRNYSRNSFDFVNRMDVDFIKNHQFNRLPDTSIDGIALYAIGIKKFVQSVSVIGEIFISKGDFKIYKMRYASYDKDAPIVSQKESETNAKPSAEKEKRLGKLIYEIIVEYSSHNGIMYPNYISFNNSFDSWQPAGFFPIDEELINSKQIKITFNKEPLEEYAIKKKNYRLLNGLEEMKIDSIDIDKNVVILHLKKEIVFESDQNQFSDPNNKIKPIIKYKNIKDVSGHLLDEFEYVSYNQFREFFVQELQIDAKRPVDTLFMDYHKPIYRDQPIVPYSNLDNYWMNTPLKDE